MPFQHGVDPRDNLPFFAFVQAILTFGIGTMAFKLFALHNAWRKAREDDDGVLLVRVILGVIAALTVAGALIAMDIAIWKAFLRPR